MASKPIEGEADLSASIGQLTLSDFAALNRYVAYADEDPNPSFRRYSEAAGRGDANVLGRALGALDRAFDILTVQHSAIDGNDRIEKRRLRYPEELEGEIARMTTEAGLEQPVGKGRRDGLPTPDALIVAELGKLIAVFVEFTAAALARRSATSKFAETDGEVVADLGDLPTRAPVFDRAMFLRWLRLENQRLAHDYRLSKSDDVDVFDLVRRRLEHLDGEHDKPLESDGDNGKGTSS